MADKKLPTSVKIGGHRWSVKLEDNLVEKRDADGMCEIHHRRITVGGDADVDYQRQVLLHEIIEAIDLNYEMKLPHHKICTLEAALHQVLNDNDLGYR